MIPREEMLHNERQANAIIEEENKRKVEVELHKVIITKFMLFKKSIAFVISDYNYWH